MNPIINSGLGMAAVHCGYVDIMRSNGSSRELKVYSELIGGIAYLVFTVWGFLTFHWWHVLLAPLLAIIPVTFVSKFLVIPQVYLLIGIVLCFAALT